MAFNKNPQVSNRSLMSGCVSYLFQANLDVGSGLLFYWSTLQFPSVTVGEIFLILKGTSSLLQICILL